MDIVFTKKSKQDQINFSHSTALALLTEAGVPTNTKLGLKKRNNCLKLTTSKGNQIIVGDTHAIWKSHQQDESVLTLFDLPVGAQFTVTVDEVQYLENVGSDKTPTQVVQVDI